MARYQILFWKHIPLGVRATDLNGTVRQNLPLRFHEAFHNAATRSGQVTIGSYTTSSFRWDDEQKREGSAIQVVAAVVNELTETWNNEEALTLFEAQETKVASQSIDLKRL